VRLNKPFSDDSGQASVEYILLLATSVTFAALLFKNLLQPAFRNLMQVITNKMNSTLFGGDLSTFPLGK
jgi:hypothetical protein